MSMPAVFQNNLMAAAPFFDKATNAFSGLGDVIGSMTTSEIQFFDEERYNESELRKKLNDNMVDKKIDAMKRVLAAVSYGRDCGPLFPEVVKNVASQNLELKKLVYIYLVLYGEQNTDLALLAINSFQKDLQDRSQIVRAAALRAMASFRMMEITQFILVAIQKASQDTSGYVRKTAAHCVLKLYSLDPDQYHELLPIVLKLLNDNEVTVVGGAIMAYHYLCISTPPATRTGDPNANTNIDSGEYLVLLHAYYRRLCEVVVQLDCWAQTYAIDILQRYARHFFGNPNAQENGVSDDFKTLLHVFVSMLSSDSATVVVSSAVALSNLAPTEEIPQTIEPLLRTLQLTSSESSLGVLRAISPMIQANITSWRPFIRDFLVRYTDASEVKEIKLEILILLCNESNVQLVLKELQVYVRWHSLPEFITPVVRAIAQVGLKESSVTEQCLKGLVKMLDSKCQALSSEAVVGVRTLLQRQRRDSNNDKLSEVCAQMVRYLDDLKAPGARASVVWILGEYQCDIPYLAPDALRNLAKVMPKETSEVKHQILVFGLKVWAFHALNKTNTGKSSSSFDPAESEKILPRLEGIFDHVCKVGSYDNEIDVRDMTRNIMAMKNVTKAALNGESVDANFAAFCTAFGKLSHKLADDDQVLKPPNRSMEESKQTARYILSSMAHLLSIPFSTYRPLPVWTEEGTEDSLRELVVEKKEPVITSLSSADDAYGNRHIENRVQNPSNISALPKVAETLEDLNLFYADDEPTIKMGNGIQGSAVAGEDSESSEDGDDNWDEIKKGLNNLSVGSKQQLTEDQAQALLRDVA